MFFWKISGRKNWFNWFDSLYNRTHCLVLTFWPHCRTESIDIKTWCSRKTLRHKTRKKTVKWRKVWLFLERRPRYPAIWLVGWWHGGLLLVRVFGKLCCQVVTLLPLLLPPLLLLHLLLHLPRLTFHCAYCSSCKKRNLKKGKKYFFYKEMQLQTEVGKRKPLWGKSEKVKVGQKKFILCKKSESWTRKDFLQVLCGKGNRPGGQDYEIIIIRLADL